MEEHELRNYIEQLLKPIFPHNVKFSPQKHRSDLTFHISWPEPIDGREKRNSKTIQIIISKEVLSDYLQKSKTKKQLDNKKLVLFIEKKWMNFKPDSDHRINEVPPTETWCVGSTVLNS